MQHGLRASLESLEVVAAQLQTFAALILRFRVLQPAVLRGGRVAARRPGPRSGQDFEDFAAVLLPS